jgi:hypothetical protein
MQGTQTRVVIEAKETECLKVWTEKLDSTKKDTKWKNKVHEM